MYKWLKAYLAAFGEDFPFSEVADKTEYEVCRIIQQCVLDNEKYPVPEPPEPEPGGDGDGEDSEPT